MKFIWLFLFFLLLPDVGAYEIIVYQETFDDNFGGATGIGEQFGNIKDSDYTYVHTGDLTSALVKSDAFEAGDPVGYTWVGEMVALDNQCDDDGAFTYIELDSNLNSIYTYGSIFEFHYRLDQASENGSWRLGYKDDDSTGVGWSTSNLNSVVATTATSVKVDVQTFPSIKEGTDEIDNIRLYWYPYFTGCIGDNKDSFADLRFWNISLSYNTRIPSRVKVWDGTNTQWLEDVNVTIVGETYKSGLTDASGIVHNNEWLENGSYDFTMTKAGYTSQSGTWNLQPCQIVTGETDTYTEYADNCGAEDRTLFEVPVDSVNFEFEVVDIFNVPLENTQIQVIQTQFPYTLTTDSTDAKGIVEFLVASKSSFTYTVGLTGYKPQDGNIFTNTTNSSLKIVMLEVGCSLPVSITPEDWDITRTNFSGSFTQEFCYELISTDYLTNFHWELDGNIYAFSYPCIEIIFTETGDRSVEARGVQTDCNIIWGWGIHLSDKVVPEQLENLTSKKQWTKKTFFDELRIYIPTMFVVVIFVSGGVLARRVGKKK